MAKDAPKPTVEDDPSPPGPNPGYQNIKSWSKPKGTSKKSGRNNQKRTDKPPPPAPSGNAPNPRSENNGSKSTPGFAEGNTVLQNYGLSVSGRKEQILSAVKTDKYFHMVEQSWQALIQAKPSISERFSYAEFRHCSALQLYHRIESVKFDALAVKPSAPTRIPLPRTTRVFQPIWSVLANIGIVDDNDLRVTYIPDGHLPSTSDGDTNMDLENLVACTLYDWNSSWSDVESARKKRKPNKSREASIYHVNTNEAPSRTKDELFAEIRTVRAQLKTAQRLENQPTRAKIVNGVLYRFSPLDDDDDRVFDDIKDDELNAAATDAELTASESLLTAAAAQEQLNALFAEARKDKSERIPVHFDVTQNVESSVLPGLSIDVTAGAYGAWLHWDRQLWLEYEQIVESLSTVAMFSLGMPNDSAGTYAWLLPVETREKSDSSVSARLPKASIPPATWTLALLTQMSTLPIERRSTFYTETDRLINVIGLRRKYIMAAIKVKSGPLGG